MNAIIRLLKEGSTWRGVVLLLTAIGVQIKPDLQAAIISLGLSVAGLLGVIVPDGDVK